MTTTYRDLGLRESEISLIEHRASYGWRRAVEESARLRADAYDRYVQERRSKAAVLVFVGVTITWAAIVALLLD